MRLNKPVRDILLLLLVIGIGAAAWWLYTPNDPHRPAFTLPDLDGTPRAIAEFDGQVIVLNFWATWCVPCRKEIPMLIEVQRELGDAGLQIVGIAVDKREPTAAFAKRYGINYPVLVDLNKAARIQDRYVKLTDARAAVLPFTVIIDRDGRIRAGVAGKLDRTRLQSLVRPLLGPDA